MRSALLGFVLMQVACSGGPTISRIPDVEVTLSRVAIEGESRMEVRLTNLGDNRVYISPCGGMWLEREASAGWVQSTADTCIPGPHPPIEVAAGHSYARSFGVVTASALRGVARVAPEGGTTSQLYFSESLDTTP